MLFTYSLNANNWFLGITIHKVPLPIMVLPNLESCKLGHLFSDESKTVFFDKAGAVRLLHNVGPGIPHVPVLIQIPFSSAKVTYARDSVLVEGQPAGMAMPAASMTPLLVCADPLHMPATIMDAFRNTVIFSFSPDDLWRGDECIRDEMVKSLLQNLVAGHFGKRWLGKWLDGKLGRVWPYIKTEQLREIVRKFFTEKLPKEGLKRAGKWLWGKIKEGSESKKLWEGQLPPAVSPGPMSKIIERVPIVGAAH